MRYDPDDNSQKSYTLAIDALRERCVRNGDVKPINAQEKRWREEGPRRLSEFDTLKKVKENV